MLFLEELDHILVSGDVASIILHNILYSYNCKTDLPPTLNSCCHCCHGYSNLNQNLTRRTFSNMRRYKSCALVFQGLKYIKCSKSENLYTVKFVKKKNLNNYKLRMQVDISLRVEKVNKVMIHRQRLLITQWLGNKAVDKKRQAASKLIPCVCICA